MIHLNYTKNNNMKRNKYKSIISLVIIQLLMLQLPVLAQKITVKGVIEDISGKPIIDALISTENNVVAKTNNLGMFEINADKGARLDVTKKGFISRNQKINDTNIKIVLTPSTENTMLSVAYGQFNSNAITSSISTVSGDILKKHTDNTVGESLYGMIPGLFVEEKSLEPGDSQLNMFIRGKSTFGSASNVPLVYIDGFERDLSTLTVEDIDKVSILKDAASCALYGDRGANGVILVTTKRGKEQKTKFNFTTEYGYQQPTKLPEFVSSSEYVKMYNQALDNDGLSNLKYSDEKIAGYENGNSYYFPNVDWIGEMVANSAPISKVNFSATGGDKNTKYYVNIGYLNNRGIYKGTEKYKDYSTNINLDKYNFRTNLDLVVLKGLSVKMDVSGYISTKNAPNSTTSSIWNAMYEYPTHEFPVEVENGVLGGTPIYRSNPVGLLTEVGYDRISSRFIQTALQTQYDFDGNLKGLSIGGRYAYDNYYTITENNAKTFGVKEVLGQDSLGNPILSQIMGVNSSVPAFSISGQSQYKRNNFEVYTQYEKVFGLNTLNAMIMYHQDKRYVDQYSPYANQLIGGRLHYGYDNTYFAEFSCSYSGSEVFAPKNRFTFYPTVSAAWVLTNENFLKEFKPIDYMKLHSSAGYVGNSSLGERFTYRQTYASTGNVIFGKGNTTTFYGLTEGTLPNEDLKPEKSFKFDAGLDARLFSSLTLNATYFFEKRSDILTTSGNQTSTIIGVALPNINAGETNVSGAEGSLVYSKQANDWGFTIGLNASYYKSVIKNIIEQPLPDNVSYQSQIGQPIGAVLGLQAIGFYQSEEEIANDPVKSQFGTVKPGDIKYKDQNGDNVINDYDRVYMSGLSLPNVDLGLTLGVNYKGFDVSAFFNAELGESIYLGDTPSLFWSLTNGSSRISQYVADRNPWTPASAETANYPRLTTQGSPNNYRLSDFWMVNGDRLRLKTLEVGYSLPTKTVKKVLLSSARFYLRGMNLFILDHLKGIDPAAMAGYPMMSSYHVGINVSF